MRTAGDAAVRNVRRNLHEDGDFAVALAAGPDTLKSDDRLLGLLNGSKAGDKIDEAGAEDAVEVAAAATGSLRNSEPLPEPELLTKRQAAALMQVSVRTLDRLVARGAVPYVTLGPRCVRFPVGRLREWLESRTASGRRR